MAETQQNQTTEVANKKASAPVRYDTDFSKGIFGSSDNFMMATQMAKALASSTIVPREYQNNWANTLIAIDIATRMKIDPTTVIQNLHVIQGRPCWSSTFLIGMINGSGKYDMELQFEEKEKNGKPFSCMAWTEKNGRRVNGIVVDMDMANAEGWTKKNGSKWITMPQVMLRYRAASFFSRMNCPEIANGFYTQDEVIEFSEPGTNYYDFEEKINETIQNSANKQEFSEVVDEPEEDSESVFEKM